VYRFRPEFRSLESRTEENGPAPELAGVAVIALNQEFIVHQLFPALVQRHLNLSGTAYHVAVFSTADQGHPVFESGPTPPKTDEKPDAEIGMVESPFVQSRNQPQRPRRSGDASAPATPQQNNPDPLRQGPQLRRYAMALPAAIIPGRVTWRVAVQHPAGSLRAAVDITRRANLMMSFGALVVLAGSIALLFAAMQRTRALSRMQMEFVAGVSHELRTPVSVICSAADNLADGVVEGKPQVQNYGQLIRGEARRLASMVEQILLFSAGKDAPVRYNLQPVDITAVVEGVLRDAQPAVTSAGMTMERAIDGDLPHVIGDGGAIARCLENLVSNAMKYGANPGGGGWMRVSATTKAGRGRQEVAISVEDHGSGIAAAELRRIFEPFYRGTLALDSQIHGTGLGLSLARKLARAMRGDIQVESELGKGSRFTLTLPAAEMPTETENESINEPVHTAD
jgi:signal transduction histidine kinase